MIISSLIFMNIFALTVSLLIVVSDRVISNYGTYKITINDDKELEAAGGQSLLRILYENKYFIPSACGGNGTCGYCKLKVTEGGGPPLLTEKLILTPQEELMGMRMACQLKVRNDLKIEIPAEYSEIQEYIGDISFSRKVTSDIRKIRIKLNDPDKISYKPGQYIQIRIDTSGGTDFRAYSIASDPNETGEIELNVKQIPDGLGSTYIHSLKVGDTVDFLGPCGNFYLRETHRKIICVAGGVGLAPLKSIVQYWKSNNINRKIELYYGTRTIKDLYDHDYFVKLAEEYRNFTYHPALSDSEEEWTGETGFIHQVLEKNMTEGESSEAYLCGPPIMIDAVTAVLNKGNVSDNRILYDKFQI